MLFAHNASMAVRCNCDVQSGAHCRLDTTASKAPFSKTRGRAETGTAPPTEALHPSWQASRKRKEQLALLKSGPSNKKIKFDEDD